MKLALLGATGAVGRTMLDVLRERRVPVEELVPLASERSRGRSIEWKGRDWTLDVPRAGVFEGCRFALFSAGADRSREWAGVARDEGAIVIDNSSAWRMDSDVPLVVPEVNARALRERPAGIIANPNCSTIQLVVALEPIRRAAGLRRVFATTLQSASGAGQKGLDALRAERQGRQPERAAFPAAIDGNAIPQVGAIHSDGWAEEERKMRLETRKIMALPDLPFAATCVRVPVEVGHSIAVAVTTEQPLSRDAALDALAAMPGLSVLDGERLPLARDAAGRDDVLVGRVRVDPDDPATLHIWVVADNLRKGAATNAVQIAQTLLDDAG